MSKNTFPKAVVAGAVIAAALAPSPAQAHKNHMPKLSPAQRVARILEGTIAKHKPINNTIKSAKVDYGQDVFYSRVDQVKSSTGDVIASRKMVTETDKPITAKVGNKLGYFALIPTTSRIIVEPIPDHKIIMPDEFNSTPPLAGAHYGPVSPLAPVIKLEHVGSHNSAVVAAVRHEDGTIAHNVPVGVTHPANTPVQ